MSIATRQLLVIICLQLLGVGVYAQEANNQNVDPTQNQDYVVQHFGKQHCQYTEPVFMDDIGKERWLTSKDLKKRAINKVSPEPFYGLRNLNAVVVVDLLVNTKGEVECIKADNGPSILRHPSLLAAKKWIFKPMIVNGKPIAYLGRISFIYTYGKVRF
jgi:hypothetical protein